VLAREQRPCDLRGSIEHASAGGVSIARQRGIPQPPMRRPLPGNGKKVRGCVERRRVQAAWFLARGRNDAREISTAKRPGKDRTTRSAAPALNSGRCFALAAALWHDRWRERGQGRLGLRRRRHRRRARRIERGDLAGAPAGAYWSWNGTFFRSVSVRNITSALGRGRRRHSLYAFRRRTLWVWTGPWRPFRVNAPTGSTSISSSTVPSRRSGMRIWPALASPQRRAARLVTVPIAP